MPALGYWLEKAWIVQCPGNFHRQSLSTNSVPTVGTNHGHTTWFRCLLPMEIGFKTVVFRGALG